MAAFGVAEVVIFGIQGGLRMYGQARQIYLERTHERALTLPLPGISHQAKPSDANAYFRNGGGRHLAGNPRLQQLHAIVSRAGVAGLSSSQQADYVEYYRYFRAAEGGEKQNGYLASDIIALNAITQWQAGDAPHPTAVRRIAGTLVEIGIEYFSQGPGRGKLAGNSPTRQLLQNLLRALDDQAFSTIGLEGVTEKLFITSLDSIAANPQLICGDPRMNDLVSELAAGLLGDVQRRLQELPDEQRLFDADTLGDAAGLVFGSLLRNGTREVLNNPGCYFKLRGEGETMLINRVGVSLLEVLSPDGSGASEIGNLFTVDTLESVVQSALAAISQYPELVDLGKDGRNGLQLIVQEIAGSLAQREDLFGPDLAPEIIRLVLGSTATHVNLLWSSEAGKPEHLLVAAVQALLQEISRASDAQPRPSQPLLRHSQLLAVIETVIEEVADNPRYVTDRVGDKPALAAAVQAILEKLAGVAPGRVSPETAAELISAGIRAAAGRREFLERPAAGDQGLLLAQVYQVILDTAFSTSRADFRAVWRLSAASILESLVNESLWAFTDYGIDQHAIAAFRRLLDRTRDELNAGGAFSIQRFADNLMQTLAA